MTKEKEIETKELEFGNYLGIGLCSLCLVGLPPLAFINMGFKIELGILFSAITMSFLIPLLIYYNLKQKIKGEK